MSTQDYKYRHFLYSNNNPHVLLPRLSMYGFFSAVGFSEKKYIFDIQFWLNLNELDKNTMFIVHDDIIAAFGYKQSSSNPSNFRSHFFRMIKTHFREDLDYRTTIQKRTEVGRMGNPNVVQLEMTPNAFKLACLTSRTEKSLEIYHFFLDLEKYVFAFLKYELEYIKEFANAKPPMMAIESVENTDSIDLSAYPLIPVDSFANTNVMYLFYLRRYRALKFGMTKDLHTRAQRHYRAFGERPGEVRLVHVIETEHASSIENSIKHACIQNDWRRTDIVIDNSAQTEIIDLNKTSIDAVVQLMDSFLKHHVCLKRKREDEIIEQSGRHFEIKKERLRLERKKIDLEMKKIKADLETKKIKAEYDLKKLALKLQHKHK